MNKRRYHKILRYDSQLKFRDANYLKCIFMIYAIIIYFFSISYGLISY